MKSRELEPRDKFASFKVMEDFEEDFTEAVQKEVIWLLDKDRKENSRVNCLN